ncbi:MAG: hypothetical protein M1838_000095 [Thelocarpon superellum]|nr:MAG: hypothetical protein M1838_000095 [Thelocarpon superellum]
MFLRQRLRPKYTAAETWRVGVTPYLVMLDPVTLFTGCFGLVTFGVYVAVNSLAPVFLQKPVHQGGYGFSVEQNPDVSFTH